MDPSPPVPHEAADILLVEDSHADAEFILWALRERGLGQHVKVVQDGQTALDYLFRLGPYRNLPRSQLPRLIILEHRIPKRSCLDVLQALKTDPDLKTVPVVVLSASDDEQDRDSCLAAGANSFVQKPISPDKFGDIVGQVAIYWMLVNVARGRPRSPADEESVERRATPADGQPFLSVLVIERSADEAGLIHRELERAGFLLDGVTAGTPEELAAALEDWDFDMVIAAHAMSGWTGLEALQTIRRARHDTPFILLADLMPEAEALEYLKQGAADYLYKDRLSRLPVAVRRALHDRAVAAERQEVQDRLRSQEQRQAVVADLGRDALGGADLLLLTGEAVSRTRDTLGVELAGYFELSGEGGSAVLRQGQGWPAGVVGRARVEIVPGSLCARVLEQDSPIVFGPRDGGDQLLRQHGVTGGVCARVGGGDEGAPVGVIGFFSTGEHTFDQDESRFVESVSHLLTEATVRHRTTDALRLLESAVAHSTESVIVTTAELEPPGPEIVYVNPAFTRLTGYQEAEVRGRSPRMLQGERTNRETLRALKERLIMGRPFSGEMVNYRKDGTEYRVEMDIAPIRDDDGAVTHYIAVQQDVTTRRMAEERLRQSQKIEAVGQLAGGVAHDFNNLLMAITGYSSLLLDRLPAGTPMHADLEEIDRAAKRGASLTQQLLAFSRRQVLEPRIVDLNDIIGDIDRMLRRTIGETIEMVTVLDPDLGQTRADPGQLQQVLVNLAANAHDAMPQGGRLTVESHNTTLDEAYVERHRPMVAGEYVQLTVSDTGTGMTEEVRARIFEPFYTTKQRGEGTGLGLATVYGIVKQSGGYIYAYSEPGYGSTFKVFLPRVREAPAPVARTPVAAPRPGSETLLVVEDEDAVRTLVTRILKERGYTVLAAQDGEEALHLVRGWRGGIDLVITDVIMPSLNGPDMVEKLAAERHGLPVLFMSGYTELSLSPHHLLRETAAFLQKPFTPQALLGKIREILDRSTPRDRPTG